MRSKFLSVAVLLAASGVPSFAQQAPPAVLVITREAFKPGNMASHNRHIPAFFALFDKAKVATTRLGVVPVSGDLNHLLYFEPHASFAAAEAATKKLEAAFAGSAALQAELDALTKQTDSLHDSQTVMMALRRTDLSYRSPAIEAVAKARYLTVTTTRVAMGRGADYADYTKQTNAAREKANLAEHSTVWQVTSGAPAGTYIVTSVSRSLSEIDDFVKGNAERTRKMTEALGGDVVVKQRQKALAEIVAASSTAVYSINRALSWPSPEFIAADPDFWKPKEPAKKEPAKK